MEETPCDLTKPRIAPQKILGNFFKIRYICAILKARSGHAIVLYNTLPAACIEKVVCMKTKEDLCHKICSTPRLPRVVLKANSHCGQQDQQEQDARTSCEQPSESKSSREGVFT